MGNQTTTLLEADNDEAFLRHVTFPEEDRHLYTTTPWQRLPLVPLTQRRPDRAMAEAPENNPTEVINLLGWHRGLHMVTGSMALRFNRATPADLEKWAGMLRAVAEEMEAAIDRQESRKN
jgi:hypothetical protein